MTTLNINSFNTAINKNIEANGEVNFDQIEDTLYEKFAKSFNSEDQFFDALDRLFNSWDAAQ